MHYIVGKAYSVITARSGSGPGKRLYCVFIVLRRGRMGSLDSRKA